MSALNDAINKIDEAMTLVKDATVDANSAEWGGLAAVQGFLSTAAEVLDDIEHSMTCESDGCRVDDASVEARKEEVRQGLAFREAQPLDVTA